jgi:division protein CdvB (Snf7/Vps24/ESCRT-III family)
MEIAMERMVEVHTEMMRVMTQDMVNHDSKELLPGMQQVLDDHSRIVQMISLIMASTNNNLPQNDLGSKEQRGDAENTANLQDLWRNKIDV